MPDSIQMPISMYPMKSGIRPSRRLRRILALAISVPSLFLGTISEANADQAPPSPWTLQISGYTHHFKGTGRRAYPSWNNVNTGLGVQYDALRSPESRWSTIVAAGVMKDSFGVYGAYAGVAGMYRLNDHRIQAKIGGGLFLLHRAFDWDEKRQSALMIAPIISIEDTHSGLGINITGSPSVNYGDKRIVSFIFVQGTLRF